MNIIIFGEDDVGCKNSFWISELFDAPHNLGRLVAPFVTHERGHVDTGSMLGFE